MGTREEMGHPVTSEISVWNIVILFLSKMIFSSKMGLRPKAALVTETSAAAEWIRMQNSVKYDRNSVKYGKQREIWSTIFHTVAIFNALLAYLTPYFGI